ncbi:MAG: EamA family transporter [Desulfobacteraceae bacterium]|nr:EamA family transporter [Desulfobacteraceae bacterium]
MTKYLPLIIFGVMLNAAAQLALKQGMRNIGYFGFKLTNFGRVFTTVAVNPYILAGLGCYVISVAVWLLVLSRVDVSFAYPLLSIGYIVTTVAAWYFFNEPVYISRWAGIIVICIGVWLITRTG